MSSTPQHTNRNPLEAAAAAVAAVKPKLRGWIHAGTFPLALAASVVLVALAPNGKARIGAVVFPLGSIAGYFFFAFVAHQVDVVGLLVKLVEVVAIVAALVPVLRDRPPQPGSRP